MPTCPKCGHTFRKRGELGDYTPDFEQFWKEYDAATLCPNASKRDAFAAWQQIGNDRPETPVLLSCVKEFKAHIRAKTGFMPHPATWLRQRRYETWLDKVAPSTANPVEGDVGTPLELFTPSTWDGYAAKLMYVIGGPKFTTWFGDAEYTPGPPATITVRSRFVHDYIAVNFVPELAKVFGRFKLEVKGG